MAAMEAPDNRSKALKLLKQFNCTFTAQTGPRQVVSFWRPTAWPDLLCAYQPKTRQLAVLHVAVTLVLASACWQPMLINKYIASLVSIRQHWPLLELRSLMLFVLLILLTVQVLLPLAYLAVIRYCNLKASSSQEITTLQTDIQRILWAVRTLKLVPQASSSTSDAGLESASMALPEACLAHCKHSEEQPTVRKQPPMADVPSASSPPAPICTPLSETATQDAGTAEEDSAAFQADVAAALESPSQTIANLVARLETLVYYRSGAQIRGLPACTAALEMLAGEGKLPTTVTEAFAVIKIIGCLWPARNQPTPLWQIWRPSAWADFFHGYTPWAKMLGPFTHPELNQIGQLAIIGSLVSLSLDRLLVASASMVWYADGLFGFVAGMGLAAVFMTFTARSNNLLVRGQKYSNMPALFSSSTALSCEPHHSGPHSSQPLAACLRAWHRTFRLGSHACYAEACSGDRELVDALGGFILDMHWEEQANPA